MEGGWGELLHGAVGLVVVVVVVGVGVQGAVDELVVVLCIY